MTSVRRFEVYGRVQGVGFRFFVWRRAESLGLVGWVRNRRDGSVEVVAGGEPAQLDLFGEQLRAGPRFARVERVSVVDEDPSALEGLAGFDVRRDR
jgi:acylphosphatase